MNIHDATAERMSPHEPDYLRAERGLWSWLTTTDHKRVALLFLISVLVAMVLGGAFAMLMRMELVRPERDLFDASVYNRFFTVHGVVMVFLFLIPAIPSVFGNFFLPIMIGAKDVAFPRLNLASWYIYLIGAIWTLVALVYGGVDTGWTFYTPYSTTSPTTVLPVTIGVFILGFSSVTTALNLIVTVHTLRTKGLRWHKMPLFVWAIYATSFIQLLATPVLGMAVLLVAIDRALAIGVFDPAVGGDPLLFQHLFWFYSHPAVYIMILPALGVMSETVCTFSRKNPASYKAIAYSSLGIAFAGFLVWGHHMFVSGMAAVNAAIFGVLSMVVAVFSAIKVFTWVGTLYRGSIHFDTPMLYFFAFLFLFVFGGMTGVAVATQSLDVHWHDTYFVVAHFHFIMVGGAVTAFLAALHYWLPKMFGRMYNEKAGFYSATAVFAGFFLTFFPQFLLGNAGMPRRYYSYPEQYQPLNMLSSGGSWLLGLAILFAIGNLVVSLKWGPKAGANPWDSRSFEWITRSPPPTHNFVGTPVFNRGPYDYALTEEEADARISAS